MAYNFLKKNINKSSIVGRFYFVVIFASQKTAYLEKRKLNSIVKNAVCNRIQPCLASPQRLIMIPSIYRKPSPVLYRTAPHKLTALYHTAIYHTALYRIAIYHTVMYHTTLYRITISRITLNQTTQHCTVTHYTVPHCTVPHCTATITKVTF